MKVGQSGRQNLLLTVLMAASAGSLLPLVGHAQQRDDLRENGPYDQRYFARAKGVASQPLPSELRKQPDITFQNDATGNTNELIILLDYSQSAQLRGLLGAEGKTDATNTPTGIERSIIGIINNKISQPIAAALQSPADARFLLENERMSDTDRLRGAKVKAPRERLERFLVLRYSSVAAATRAMDKLRIDPSIASVQQNKTTFSSWIPNDPYFSSNSSPFGQYQWGLHAMKFPTAWDKALGHAQIGLIEYGHLGTYSAAGNSVAIHPELMLNARPHFMAGLQFPVTATFTQLRNSHPVHVAGIIAAQTNNGTSTNPPSGGVAGACVNCSVTSYSYHNDKAIAPGAASEATQLAAITKSVDGGMQIINWSGSLGSRYNCPSASAICAVLDYVAEREVLFVISAGNEYRNTSDLLSPNNFSAIYPVLPVGGTEIYSPAPGVAGSRWYYGYVPNAQGVMAPYGSAEATMDGVIAPAKSIVSTMLANSTYFEADHAKCADSASGDESSTRFSNGVGDGIGSCTGTSMAAPFVSALAGIIRSVNPRLTAIETRQIIQQNGNLAGNRTATFGYGMPNASTATSAAIGTNTNKLTPLFSFYSVKRSDSFYTTVPQMGNAALDGSLMPRRWLGATAPMGTHGVYVPSYGRNVFPYPLFPRWIDFVIGGTEDTTSPKAEVWLFTTHVNPKSTTTQLSPIYRMSWKCDDDTLFPPAICASNPTHVDTVLVGETELAYFQYLGYKTDGLEGYVYPKSQPQPAGTTRLIRKYNVARDDHAIFPETKWSTMQGLGYVENTNTTDWLGYVYPNSTGYMPSIL